MENKFLHLRENLYAWYKKDWTCTIPGKNWICFLIIFILSWRYIPPITANRLVIAYPPLKSKPEGRLNVAEKLWSFFVLEKDNWLESENKFYVQLLCRNKAISAVNRQSNYFIQPSRPACRFPMLHYADFLFNDLFRSSNNIWNIQSIFFQKILWVLPLSPNVSFVPTYSIGTGKFLRGTLCNGISKSPDDVMFFGSNGTFRFTDGI